MQKIISLKSEVRIKRPVQEVFEWHFRKGSFERLMPPWWNVKNSEENWESNFPRLNFFWKIGLSWKKWEVERTIIEFNLSFCDRQIFSEIFSEFKHFYHLKEIDEKSCILCEEINFVPSSLIFKNFLQKELKKAMDYRHRTLVKDLELLAHTPKKSMRILVSGTSGLIGSALLPFLKTAGHQVVRLVRTMEEKEETESIYWNPKTGEIQKEEFEDFDAVIHLAGKNIGAKRWNKKLKEELFLSRCRDTWLLSQVLVRLYRPPKSVIVASAVGIYGNQGKKHLTESDEVGDGFLANLCKKWEEGALPIENRGSRVVHTRFGVVLSPKGGMLKQLIPLFRLGLGPKLGSGEQIISWISIDDVISAIYFCLMNEEISGPVNVTAPHPVSQIEFANALAHHFHKKVFLHFSEKWLEILGGEMAEEMILSSSYVIPEKLLKAGYAFRLQFLEEAFNHLLA